jgi:hypothetical protein
MVTAIFYIILGKLATAVHVGCNPNEDPELQFEKQSGRAINTES